MESLINKLEKEYEQYGVENAVQEETKRNTLLQAEKLQLKREFDELTEELKQLINIRDVIPKKCHNTVNLEQEGL